MGTVDRVLRVVAAVLVLVLYLTGQITGTAALILGIIAVIFVLTSTVGSCPLYLPMGWSTRREA